MTHLYNTQNGSANDKKNLKHQSAKETEPLQKSIRDHQSKMTKLQQLENISYRMVTTFLSKTHQ